MYPESSTAHTNLGDAYSRSGERELAMDSYKKALEKNGPFDGSVIKRKMEA